MLKKKIIGVDIFLEKRKTRLHVGMLNKIDGKFVFTYSEPYFKAKHAIPLGPELPLTQRKFSSEKLFPSLEDRIPSLHNPAYPEYCAAMGISPNEKDPIVLLSTIGKRGPSSFMFYPIFEREITAEDAIQFRNQLGMTTREFAAVFEFSQSALNAFERKRSAGNKIRKQLEIIIHFPDIALNFLSMNGGCLIHEKWVKAMQVLEDLSQ